MARRKSKLLQDGMSSSEESQDEYTLAEEDYDPNNPDHAAERELFTNPYQHGRKRRRREDAQEDALYGVWAESSESTAHAPTRRRQGAGRSAPNYNR